MLSRYTIRPDSNRPDLPGAVIHAHTHAGAAHEYAQRQGYRWADPHPHVEARCIAVTGRDALGPEGHRSVRRYGLSS